MRKDASPGMQDAEMQDAGCGRMWMCGRDGMWGVGCGHEDAIKGV